MNEARIVIDAAHGGEDTGATGNEIIEKNLTLAISQYMYDRFKTLGIPVTMIRTSDETVSPTERVRRILAAYGDNPNVIVISNHIDSGGGEGAEVVYALRNNSTLADMVLNELSKAGQVTKETYQRRLPTDPPRDYYFIHRDTGVTQPIIIEYGFLDNAADATRLKSNYKKYAEAVVKAVTEYIRVPYGEVGGNFYTVQSGDSLWSVAKKFNVTVEELKLANNLTSNLLSVGQKLKIPTIEEIPQPGEYIVYTVQSGDSLYSIARKYNTNVDELIKYNNLSTSLLSVGEQILIPKQITEEPTPGPTPAPTGFINYTVKSGDNLYDIASKYNTTVTQIKTDNNLTSNLLNIGQVLKIRTTSVPTPTPTNYISYTVKSGDNLYDIANRYSVTVTQIKTLNNLTSNLLNIGQVLKIPSTNVTYVVKSGDNLYDIASRYNTTVDEIKRKNNLTTNLLDVGQILII